MGWSALEFATAVDVWVVHNYACGRYTKFIIETLEDREVRMPEMDALVPAFMSALTGESGANATELCVSVHA